MTDREQKMMAAAIWAALGTTPHSIEMPPEDPTPEEHDAWWVRTHCWRVEIKDTTKETP